MSRTFRILVAKTILAFTGTTAGAAVVSQAKTTVVASPVNRPLQAATNAQAMTLQEANEGRMVLSVEEISANEVKASPASIGPATNALSVQER